MFCCPQYMKRTTFHFVGLTLTARRSEKFFRKSYEVSVCLLLVVTEKSVSSTTNRFSRCVSSMKSNSLVFVLLQRHVHDFHIAKAVSPAVFVMGY